VKANGGAAGIDHETMEKVSGSLGRQLYQAVGNRMCSGSYFPPPVKAVPIPKEAGGGSGVGVRSVRIGVAQTVASCRWSAPGRSSDPHRTFLLATGRTVGRTTPIAVTNPDAGV